MARQPRHFLGYRQLGNALSYPWLSDNDRFGQRAMPIPNDARELTPGYVFREGDPSTLYWIRDGQVIYRRYPVKGAHADSFRWYAGSFGKDRRNCFCTFHKLAGGNGATFRALNYTYATDGKCVWTMGGKIQDAD